MFALTNRETSEGGKFTRQFFRGTKATSAVVEGFLGAILRRTLTDSCRSRAAQNIQTDGQ